MKTNKKLADDFAAELMLERVKKPSNYSTGVCILTKKCWSFSNWYWYNSFVSDDEEDANDPDVLTITDVIFQDFHLSCEYDSECQLLTKN